MFDKEARKIVWLTGQVARTINFQAAKEKNWNKNFNNKISRKRIVVIWVLDISD
jgi:hypothetical protein